MIESVKAGDSIVRDLGYRSVVQSHCGPELVLLSTKEAAEALSISSGTLKKSRMTHVLLNRTPPPHVALTSTTVRYRLSDIIAWLKEVLERADPKEKES